MHIQLAMCLWHPADENSRESILDKGFANYLAQLLYEEIHF